MALKVRTTRDDVNARDGSPRVACVSLCNRHDYLTFSGECSCGGSDTRLRFAVVGTSYGWLHNSAGDVQFWQSESGARHALEVYQGVRHAN